MGVSGAQKGWWRLLPSGILWDTMIPSGMLLILILCSVFLGGWRNHRERRLLLEEVAQLKSVTSLARQLSDAAFDERRNLLSFRFRPDPTYLDKLEFDWQRQSMLLQKLSQLTVSLHGKRILSDYEHLRSVMPAMRDELISAIRQHSERRARSAFARWELVAQQSEALMADLSGHHIARLERVENALVMQESRLRFSITVIGLAVLAWIVISGINTYRVLVRPLLEMTEVARGISSGNLELRVPPSRRGGEVAALGEAFNKTASDLIRANSALQESLDELHRSNEELEQFAYVASHDLKEPLRMVNTYVQLLKRELMGVLSERSLRYLDFATGGASRMNELIDGLLEYSRIALEREHGRAVSCEAALHDALGNLESALRDSGAQICVEQLPEICGNRMQVTRLFQNLISNAVKFRGDLRPRIAITCQARSTDWLFSVTDNGIGIDPKYAERIFLIFQRLHTLQKYPGTGIGLSICKKIVEQHGGEIWVESQVGTGARFHFSLPRMV